MSVTETLATRVAATGIADLTPAARRATHQLVLDGIAVAIAGARQPAVDILAGHLHSVGSGGDVPLIGRAERLGPVAAALVGGAAMHVLDFEPMWSPANHALSTTLPAVLALAAERGLDGARVAAALVVGVELQGWLRHASRQWEPEHLRFHPPGVVGPLGAAAASAHLLGLDAERIRHALGIAASSSGALMANVGTMTKSLHCGHAAAAGLEAALLAERGFTADPDIFDSPRGFRLGFAPDLVADELTRFGAPFRLVDPGYALKLYPCQYGTHFGIDAALQLRARLGDDLDGGSIRRAHLVTPVMAYVDRPRPSSGLDGKFSLQYTAAVALLDGRVVLDTFTDSTLRRADVAELLGRVEVEQRADIEGRFEAMRVELTVELADGRVERQICHGPPGIWGGPAVAEGDHHAKVRDCLVAAGRPPDESELVALSGRLETLTPVEVGRLAGGGVAAGGSVRAEAWVRRAPVMKERAP